MNHDSDEELGIISKSALKREAETFLGLAEKLVALPKKQLVEVPLGDNLADAVALARRLDNYNARKRQLRYVARLLREDDSGAVEQALESFHQQDQFFRSRISQAETWSMQLLEGDEQLLESLIEDLPGLNRQQLRQLIRQANKDKESGKKPSPAEKKLFDCLQQALRDSN